MSSATTFAPSSHSFAFDNFHARPTLTDALACERTKNRNRKAHRLSDKAPSVLASSYPMTNHLERNGETQTECEHFILVSFCFFPLLRCSLRRVLFSSEEKLKVMTTFSNGLPFRATAWDRRIGMLVITQRGRVHRAHTNCQRRRGIVFVPIRGEWVTTLCAVGFVAGFFFQPNVASFVMNLEIAQNEAHSGINEIKIKRETPKLEQCHVPCSPKNIYMHLNVNSFSIRSFVSVWRFRRNH